MSFFRQNNSIDCWYRPILPTKQIKITFDGFSVRCAFSARICHTKFQSKSIFHFGCGDLKLYRFLCIQWLKISTKSNICQLEILYVMSDGKLKNCAIIMHIIRKTSDCSINDNMKLVDYLNSSVCVLFTIIIVNTFPSNICRKFVYKIHSWRCIHLDAILNAGIQTCIGLIAVIFGHLQVRLALRLYFIASILDSFPKWNHLNSKLSCYYCFIACKHMSLLSQKYTEIYIFVNVWTRCEIPSYFMHQK